MSIAAVQNAGAARPQSTTRPKIRPLPDTDPGNLGQARSVVDLAEKIACSREQLRQAIAEAAYFRAEQRGFAPGHELEDWLAAQGAIDDRRI